MDEASPPSPTVRFLIELLGDDVYKSLPRFVPTRVDSGRYRTFEQKDNGEYRVAICERDSSGELKEPFLAIQLKLSLNSSNAMMQYDQHSDNDGWEIGIKHSQVFVYLFNAAYRCVCTCYSGSTRYEGPFTVVSESIPVRPGAHRNFFPLQCADG